VLGSDYQGWLSVKYVKPGVCWLMGVSNFEQDEINLLHTEIF
jgi:hypothetical protein